MQRIESLLVNIGPNYCSTHKANNTAINYAYTQLSRNTAEPAAMLARKNRTGSLIVCYDDCERDAPRVVTTLTQRGYDNVVLLSGGARHAHNLARYEFNHHRTTTGAQRIQH